MSYYPENGSVSFWYITIGTTTLKNPTFVQYGSAYSVAVFSYYSYNLKVFVLDAMSGKIYLIYMLYIL